jgi:DNA-binding beta-propeller fold protein YncE
MRTASLFASLLGATVVTLITMAAERTYAQATDPHAAPNPYRMQENWAQLPAGRKWGSTIGVDIDPDGKSIWTFDRCAGNDCMSSVLAPIQKFDASGNFVTSFGIGMVNGPHGFHVDREGNVWVSDQTGFAGKGHTVMKFSPTGKLLMTLGTPGVAGEGPGQFDQPTDIYVAPNGDIFVSQGHGARPTDRITKFSKDGKFIKSWGKRGSGPGEFNVPHNLQMDSQGRLFVDDRANNRIQIFDQDGKFLAEWKQFGRPSGLFIDKNDILYSADHQSGDDGGKVNPGFKKGIRIGSVKDGKVTAFIPEIAPDANMPEGIAADAQGNIYGGWTGKMNVRRWVKN